MVSLSGSLGERAVPGFLRDGKSPRGDNSGHLAGAGSHSSGTVLTASAYEESASLPVCVEGEVALHHFQARYPLAVQATSVAFSSPHCMI